VGVPAPLNVCLISQEFPPHTNWGGVGVQFDLLARGLSTRGHRVVVVSRAAPGAPAFERVEPGFDVWRIGVPISRKRFMGRTLDRILHARAVAAKVAEVDRAQRFDVLESVVASLDAERLVADPRFAGRTVICCHGSNFMGQAVGGPLAALHRRDWKWSGRREVAILRSVPVVVVSSAFTKEYVSRQGVRDDQLEIVPLGVDTSRFTPTPERRSDGPLVVGFVGRLEHVKGIDFVWRVMDALGADDRIRFTLKGNIHPATRGEVLQRLERHAAIATHEPAGMHAEMPAFLRSLDVLLLPSRVENFGLTFAEGMATGLVVFAGRGGAGSEMVRDGVTGFLVDPDGSPQPIVDRLRALADDRSLYADVRRQARARIVQHFSLDSFVAAKERQYRRVRSL
jgi:glycosyltransferase involved in cell wall biosynthesis